MSEIKMTYDTMLTRVRSYNNEAEKIGEVITTMDKLLTTLQTEWTGAASQAYADKFRELKPSFTSAQQLVKDIASALQKTAEAYKTMDDDIASKFKGK